MGHRASYVLIEGGTTQIYYSHWGAKHVPEDILAGPQGTMAFLRTLEPDTQLMDTAWAEGGILLDVDRRHLLFWGGEAIAYDAYLRRVFLPGLRRLWPGWRVEWATQGIVDFARSLGIDVQTVLAGSVPDWPLVEYLPGSPEDMLEDDEKPGPESSVEDGVFEDEWEPDAYSLLTVQWEDGRRADYLFTYPMNDQMSYLLGTGPSALDFLRDKAADAVPREGERSCEEGAYVNMKAKEIWIWQRETLDPRYLWFLEARWPGWHIEGHVDGIVRQVQLSGRDPSGVAIADDKALSDLIECLTFDSHFDPAEMLSFSEQFFPPGTEVWTNPEFFILHPSPNTPDERAQILRKFFQ